MSAWHLKFEAEGPGQIDVFEVGELLNSLTNKSLVTYDEAAGRYRMLETVRDYARIKADSECEAVAARERHLEYFLALSEEAKPQLTGTEAAKWLDRLETEHDNLRGALEWSSGDSASAGACLRISGALWRFWETRGHLSDGRSQLERALKADTKSAHTGVRADALNGLGVIVARLGDYEAGRLIFQESLEIRKEIGDRLGVARSIGNLGWVASVEGDFDLAIPLFEESLAISREIGDKWGMALMLGNLGDTAVHSGDNAACRPLLEESLAIRRELNDLHGSALAIDGLADLALTEGDFAEARLLYKECLAISMQLRDRRGIAESLEGLAASAAGERDAKNAARLWGFAEALREAIGSPIQPQDRSPYERSVVSARELIDPEAFLAAWNAGRVMKLEEAVGLALGEQEI